MSEIKHSSHETQSNRRVAGRGQYVTAVRFSVGFKGSSPLDTSTPGRNPNTHPTSPEIMARLVGNYRLQGP